MQQTHSISESIPEVSSHLWITHQPLFIMVVLIICWSASPLSAFQVHETFDVKEKVPRVGGRELDLYMLYRNVTSLGGCERVIQTKHWREAAESFQFPETITSVSFSLRKAYFTFLWDYEQVCFIHLCLGFGQI